ncbi:MAG: stage V sporulation protein S, partial [Peptostreptococcaceae bacterium]
SSNVSSLAGAIVKSIEEHSKVELHSIGASSVNQSCKSLAIARGILATKGLDLSVKIGFDETEIEGLKKTLIKFILIIN